MLLQFSLSEYPEVLFGLLLVLIVLWRKLRITAWLYKAFTKLMSWLRWAFILLILFVPFSIYRTWQSHKEELPPTTKTVGVLEEEPLHRIDRPRKKHKNSDKRRYEGYEEDREYEDEEERYYEDDEDYFPDDEDSGNDARKKRRDSPAGELQTLEQIEELLRQRMEQQKNQESARATAEQILQKSWQGQKLYQEGRLEEALEVYDAVVAMAPFKAKVYGDRAVIYSDLKRYEDALRDYGQALSLQPTAEEMAEIYNNRGTLFQETGSLKKALADYNAAIAKNPNFAVAYINRGRLFRKMARHDDAIADWQHAIELGTEHKEKLQEWIARLEEELDDQ